jgi:uncharacterized membrane protein YhhN
MGIPLKVGIVLMVTLAAARRTAGQTAAGCAAHDSSAAAYAIRRFPTSAVAVRREIRGSELWACQPDGSWRIRRWVSAPEHWVRVE